MYAIKARFDGAAIIPAEEIPVTGPYEAIVTFTQPVEDEKPAKKTVNDLAEYFGCFRENSPWEGDGVEVVRKMRDEW
jgi:hypothetical protein